MRRPRVPQKSPRLTMEEIERLLDAIAEQSFPERDMAMILPNASEGKSRQLSAKGWRLSRLLVVSSAEPPLFACDGISDLVAAPRLAVRRDPALGLLHVGLNVALAGPLLDF